jgi:hypothetical protein
MKSPITIPHTDDPTSRSFSGFNFKACQYAISRLHFSFKYTSAVLTKHEECVCRLHEYQNAPKQILIENAILDVVSMMFYTERQQL